MSTSEPPPGAPNEPSDLIGALFADRFRLASLVSEGANTTVFDAVDERNGRTVTVKLIQPAMSSSPDFRARFDTTMRSAAALSHPNIAAVYDWGVARLGDSATAYVVVEQLSGGSWRDMFDRARLLSPSQALAVGLDACRGLDYAHRRGFVHGELTPSKLVFGDDRRLRLTDFGLARLLNEHTWLQPDSVPNHTAWYASPEQGLARPIDGKTDVYALCLTLQEAVTGNLPFKNDSTVASLTARVGKLMTVSADLGPLASVLEHAGRPEADERSSAAQFGKELVTVASKLPRPEPLPLLSTGLFETPTEQLRAPDDPTGGMVRPLTAGAPIPEPPLIIEAEPDAEIPKVDDGDELVILPLDSDPDAAETVDGAVGGNTAADAADGVADDAAADLPVATVALGGSPSQHEPEPDASPDREPLVGDTDPYESNHPDTAIMGLVPAGADGEHVGRSAHETTAMPITDTTPGPTRRRGFPWKILLSLLVVAALVVLGVLATRLFETPTFPVPDLVELPEAEAVNMVAPNGWEISTEVERSDVVPTAGLVVRTAPQDGVDLAEGEPFLIVVSGGPTLRELPESAGVALSEAQTRLVERGLDVTTEEAFDEDVPEGTVISWSVPGDPTLTAGAEVEPGTVINLIMSIGPAPRSIPEVVGHTVAAARAEIEALGLTLTEGDQEFSDEVPLGSIIAQSLPVGTEVPRGADLTVLVSKGPDLVRFPDITDLTFDEAVVRLAEAGFIGRLTFGDAQGTVRSYTVDRREPAIGETFRRGTQVDIRAL